MANGINIKIKSPLDMVIGISADGNIEMKIMFDGIEVVNIVDTDMLVESIYNITNEIEKISLDEKFKNLLGEEDD